MITGAELLSHALSRLPARRQPKNSQNDFSMTEVDVFPSSLSGMRNTLPQRCSQLHNMNSLSG
jgi:hypothetical protein